MDGREERRLGVSATEGAPDAEATDEPFDKAKMSALDYLGYRSADCCERVAACSSGAASAVAQSAKGDSTPTSA